MYPGLNLLTLYGWPSHIGSECDQWDSNQDAQADLRLGWLLMFKGTFCQNAVHFFTSTASTDSDQTAPMCKLIWDFPDCMCLKVHFLIMCLVYKPRESYKDYALNLLRSYAGALEWYTQDIFFMTWYVYSDDHSVARPKFFQSHIHFFLRYMGTLRIFTSDSESFQGETTITGFYLLPVMFKSFHKDGYSQRKEFAPSGDQNLSFKSYHQ